MAEATSSAAQTEDKGVEAAIQYAKKYLEDILSFFGLNTDIYATTEDNEVIELHVPSTHLNGFLIGQRGETMRALQFTVSSALKNNGFESTRVNVDVADYKKSRAERLASQVEEWVNKVKESGEPMHLKPMNPADRRTVHRVATDEGLETESEGEGRDRHVVLKPAPESATKPKAKPAIEPDTESEAEIA
jgi:spoIIIJ-associated protein